MRILYMPYIIKKVRGKPCYRVQNKYTKKVFAKCSTEENAKKQIRLLRAIEYNKSFKLRPSSKGRSTRKMR
jgi:hypothetical protein